LRDFLVRIKGGEILLSDGAMGTMLIERGITIDQCLEMANLSHPEIIEEIAQLYLRAGSDIIHTNTFGGSPLKLAGYSLEDKTAEINQSAVRAAKKAVGDSAYISGSVGPCGRILKPYGDIEPEQVYDSFAEQIRSLIAAGVDILCIETMTDINEAELAIGAARSVSKTIPIMATMTFDPTSRGYYTVMGTNIETAAKALTKAGADIIGSNCGNGIEKMIEIAREFKSCSTLPLIIQSNAGLPKIVDGQPQYSETPEFMADKCAELIEVGVSVIGGCCGTTPEHIAAIRSLIDSPKNKPA
jgi:5-methyltetrahydrofolate--homocysteine methyltransferase